jgi:hypothetical protein
MSIYQIFILTLAATAAAASTFTAVVAFFVDGRVKHGYHFLP